MQEYTDTVQGYIGATCEVLRLDNKLLFAGYIQEYDEETEDLTILIRRNQETPQGIIFHTPVKLHVQTKDSNKKVLLLYGIVAKCSARYWVVTLKHTFSCSERRSSFRQPIRMSASVCRGFVENPSATFPCQMIDISISGLSFQCKESFMQGEQIVVYNLQLVPEGRIYSFNCTIRRIQKIEDDPSGGIRYGCRINDLSEQQEDRLFHDFFTLQVDALQR